ncbi:MAG: hypothetical protein BGO49_07515 [Planctomycetales bacterium 71-10]|nr:MAG: hypothetical protein BGO49_07515 [Planctomycetales bacterium 71-10]
MGLWRGLMRGAKAFAESLAEGPEPFHYVAGDLKVACPHCQGDLFHQGYALRNTRGRTLAGLDWTDGGATTLTCDRCGLIQWFGREPRRVEPKPKPGRDWSNE